MTSSNFIPKRLIAVGDIHGQLSMLNSLLEDVGPKRDDQFVFLGDYIDRGNDSRGVIDRLIKFQADFPRSIFIRGNHDQFLLDALVEMGLRDAKRLREMSTGYSKESYLTDMAIFLSNGGQDTLESYHIDNLTAFPRNHVHFLESTQFYWKFERYIFVHAGVEAGIPLDKQDPYTLLWDRLNPPGKDGDIHVIGHNPTGGQPRFEAGCYHLDTGAVYGQSLTACDVFTKEIWQAK
jgi:predicted phosphodiesterase